MQLERPMSGSELRSVEDQDGVLIIIIGIPLSVKILDIRIAFIIFLTISMFGCYRYKTHYF